MTDFAKTVGPARRILRLLLACLCGGMLTACQDNGGAPASDPPRPPSIAQQPASARATEGDATEFAVRAEGDAPLSYQWARGGSDLAGETAAVLRLPAVALSDHGSSFQVRVSNSAGTVTSADATLAVAARARAPRITVPNAEVQAVDGQQVELAVSVEGTAPWQIQWTVDGQPISGAQSNGLALTATLSHNGALYRAEATNAAGSNTSTPIRLTVTAAPTAPGIVAGPSATQVTEGQSAVFAVDATGTPPLSYQWLRNDTELPGATTARLTLSHLGLEDHGARYRVRVANAAGSVLSAHALLSVQRALPLQLIAGHPGSLGNLDGAGRQARFSNEGALVMDSQGVTWVADTWAHVIRRVRADGQVTTFAGKSYEPGTADGAAAEARFHLPVGIALAPGGDLIVADQGNNALRRITPAGVVSTITLAPGADLGQPIGVVAGTQGQFIVMPALRRTLLEVLPTGEVRTLAGQASTSGTLDGVGDAARFNYIGSTTCASPVGAAGCADAVLVTDAGRVRHVRFTAGSTGQDKGLVTTVAGAPGLPGGSGRAATETPLVRPWGLVALPAGKVWIGDTATHGIVELDLGVSGGTTRWVAGSRGLLGWADGVGTGAQLNRPVSLATAPGSGRVAVFDADSGTVRGIDAAGRVTTLAGFAPESGTINGAALSARFNEARALHLEATGTLLIGDGCRLRRLDAAGQVTTLIGALGCGAVDGAAGEPRRGFGRISGIATDAAGNIYVADSLGSTIRRLARDGTLSTFAGLINTRGNVQGAPTSARFSYPVGIVLAPDGNFYVADAYNRQILKISANGVVNLVAGGPSGTADGFGYYAQFVQPGRIALTASGDLLVSDWDRVRRVTPGGTVTTLAGGGRTWGDGAALEAGFGLLGGLAVVPGGDVYVADYEGCAVRRIRADGQVDTPSGVHGECGIVVGSRPRLASPNALIYDGARRQLITTDHFGIFGLGLP